MSNAGRMRIGKACAVGGLSYLTGPGIVFASFERGPALGVFGEDNFDFSGPDDGSVKARDDH